MTNGQKAQLQELAKCYFAYPHEREFVDISLVMGWSDYLPLKKREEKYLRRLWHQYRHQIAAMRKNRVTP